MFLRKTAAALVTAALVAVGSAAAIVAPASAAITVGLVAPQNLQTQVVDGDTRFTWDGVDGATGYTLQLATDDQFASSNIVATRTTTARTWIPERTLGRVEDRGLYWRVAAHSSGVTDASRGEFSTPALADARAAGAPSLESPAYDAVVDYPNPVTFRWTPVRGAISYTLTYSSSAEWASGVTTVVPGITGTAHTPTAPLARTSSGAPVQWYWKVQAVFANPLSTTTTADPITGPASASGMFTVRWTAESSAPTLLWPTSTDPIQSDLTFSWTPVAGATRYAIAIGQSVDDATGLVTTVKISADSTSTTFVPLTQLVDGNYWWQVTAYDPGGNPGQPSEAKQFRKAWGQQSAPTAPASDFTKTYPVPTFGSPNYLDPTQVTLDDFLLTWNPVPRATLYEVEAIPIAQSETDPRKTMTCRTASTSVGIVAKVIEGSNDGGALDGDGACLWHTNKAYRMDSGGLYEWRVRAIDYSGSATTALQTTTPAGSQESLWSDMGDGDTSRKRYFYVDARRPATDVAAVVDDTVWTAESTTTIGKPAPLMKWSPVAYANAYQVDVFHDYDCSVLVTTQYTPQTHLRINGVFDDETSGEYCWRVRGVVANDQFTEFTVPVGSAFSPPRFWQKSSTPIDFVGTTPVTTMADGSVLFSWRPQSLSAPGDGGSRGYAVTVLDSSLVSRGTLKVEYPWYVAKTLDTSQKPLAPGSYWFKVAALDALGNPGNYTSNIPFTVAAPAPTGLTTRVDGTTATLAWTGTTAAAKYGFKVRPVGGSWPTAATQVTQTSATIRDLDDGTYEWLVFSYDNSNYASLEATSGTFTIAAPVPARVTADGAVLTTNNRVLDWEPVEGASRYLVQYAAAAGSLDVAAPAETYATSFAIPATLPYGTTYYWQVTAVPEKATTASTRVKLGKSSVGSFSVTNPPAGVALSRVTVTGTQAEAQWATPTGANRGSVEAPAYRLAYRASNTTGTGTDWSVLEIDAGTESRTLTGLATSTTYEFQLQAYNSEGGSAWSAIRSGTTAGAPKAAVTDLVATPTATSLRVAWSAPGSTTTGGSPITGYSVMYRKGTGSWVTVPSAATSTTTNVTIAGLTAKSSYTISVAPRNAVGEGPAATLSVATLGVPTAPTDVKAARGDASATLTWSPPASNGGSAITAYVLQYRAKSATTGWTTWRSGPTVSASARTAKVTSLKNGSYYQIRVAARTQLGSGAWSTAAAVTPATKPSAPTSVKATSPATKTVKVTWRASVTNGSKISAYRVEYSTGSTWKTLATTSATATSYTWSKATKGTTYSFRVVATSNLGNSPASTVVRVVAR